MKRINFREVNKIMKKHKDNVSQNLLELIESELSCDLKYHQYLASLYQLNKFRNTKISEGV